MNSNLYGKNIKTNMPPLVVDVSAKDAAFPTTKHLVMFKPLDFYRRKGESFQFQTRSYVFP